MLPHNLRGICDLRRYATFASLARLPYPTDHAAAAAGLPPLDSVDAWPALTAGSSWGAAPVVEAEADSERSTDALGSADPQRVAAYTHAELPLSSSALLDARTNLKLLRGAQQPAGWQGPRYPNATSHLSNPNYQLLCGVDGCLFNVSSDPYEHNDLAAAMPDVARAMRKRLDELAKSFFENHDNASDSCPAGVLPPGVPCACWMAVYKYGGVMGPFQEVTV